MDLRALKQSGYFQGPEVFVTRYAGLGHLHGLPSLSPIGREREVGLLRAVLIGGHGNAGGIVFVDLITLAALRLDAEEFLQFPAQVRGREQIPNRRSIPCRNRPQRGPANQVVGLFDGVNVGGVASVGLHDQRTVVAITQRDTWLLGGNAALGLRLIDLRETGRLAVDRGGEIRPAVVVRVLLVGGVD